MSSKKVITFKQIALTIGRAHGVSDQDATNFLDDFLDEITRHLEEGSDVNILGLRVSLKQGETRVPHDEKGST
jgi:nucleoid DNA-binding protein